jgi:CheY-like chemotaxis protein
VKEVSVDFLRNELIRLGAGVTLTRVLHPSGVKLHSPGDLLTFRELGLMKDLGIDRIFLLESGEGEHAAQQALSTELVATEDLLPGDVVGEEIRGPEGQSRVAPGAVLDPPAILAAQALGVARVTIRKRGLDASALKARLYLASLPEVAPRPPRPDPRLSQVMRVSSLTVRPLLVPRAKVVVAVRDDFVRALIQNSVAAEGHDASESRMPLESAREARGAKPDLLVIDLADAPAVCLEVRQWPETRSVAILVCAAEGHGPEVYQALQAGANDSLATPPRPDQVQDKLRACLSGLGRRVNVEPSIQAERRAVPRRAGHFVCSITDRFLSKPLPVASATVLDVSEGGLRIEYPATPWPDAFAYTGHTVHPRHFFYHYSRASPLGRDVTVTLPGLGGGPALDTFARFLHISRHREWEVAGIAFQQVRASVRQHLTLIRGKTEVTGRRPAF